VAVEQALLAAVPNSVAFRASIVIAAQSRSFRFLVRLIERLPAIVVPSWGANRTYPVDGRDVIDYLARAAAAPEDAAGSYDAIGPDVMSYAEMLERIASHMLVDRPTFSLPFNLTPVASVVAAGVAGEDVGLIGPLMESLDYDLLPRDERAAETFGVRLHSFDAAVERSLREWESVEEVRAR
jgi:nucleoside-diphosphate-sugar epimerase